MSKMCLAFLGALLLALHLISSQVVQAQTIQATTTDAPMDTTMSNYTVMSTVVTTNTTSKGGCGRTDAFTLLLPLAVGASLLLGWS